MNNLNDKTLNQTKIPNENLKTHPLPITFEKLYISHSENIIDYEIICKNISFSKKEENPSIDQVKENSLVKFEFYKENKKCMKYFNEKYLIIRNAFDSKSLYSGAILPNIFAFFIIILIMMIQTYVKQYISCQLDSSNILLVIYILLKENCFTLTFYFLYAVFSLINIESKYLFFLCPINASIFLLLKIYQIDPITNYSDLHSTSLILYMIIALIYFKKYKISLKIIIKKFVLILYVAVFPLFFNYYVMKTIIIPKIYYSQFQLSGGKILFQIFIFIYFRIYGKIFFLGIVQYVNFSKNEKKCEMFIALFSKYYVLDAISSAFPAAITEDLSSMEAWLGICNYIYQIYVLYDHNHNLRKIFKIFLYKILRKKINCQSISNENEIKAKEMFTNALHEMLIIIYLRSALFICFKAVLVSNYHTSIKIECDYLVNDDIFNMKIENLIIIFYLNNCVN